MGNYKYEPLKTYLMKSKKETVVLSFDEINRILGSELPPCLSRKGYNKKLLWNNNILNYATKSWLEADYVFESCDKEKGNVPEAKRYMCKY